MHCRVERLFKKNALALILIATMAAGQSPAALAQEWINPDTPGTNKALAFKLYQKAIQCFQIGDYNSAIHLLKGAQSNDPANKQVIHMLALAYSEFGDNYNAMLQFGAALTLDYNYIECRNNYGLFLRKTGKMMEAEKAWEECTKIKPTYPDAWYHLGEVYKGKGDLDAAIECFQTAINNNPRYFDALRDLGLTLFEKYTSGQGGDVNECLQKLQEAAQLIPDNPMIHYNLGSVFCSQSMFDQAEREFRIALNCDAKHAAAHYELAKLRYFRGDADRCLYECNEASKISPVYTDGKKYPKVDVQSLRELEASCYEVKGQLIEAVEKYRQAASLQHINEPTLKHIAELEKILRSGRRKSGKNAPVFDPEEVNALIKRGVQEIEGGDMETAKRTFQRALELNPQCYEAVQHLGEIMEASGDLNGALAKYQAASALRPRFDGAYFNLAYVLEKMNLASDAGMMYQRFHEIAGKYPYDPRHIVAIQQEEVRKRARDELIKKRGY